MSCVILSGSGSSSDIRASYAAARGPAASRTKFCSHDSFLSASSASLGSLFLIMLSSLGQFISSPMGSPTCASQVFLVLLSTGLGSQKVASKKALVSSDVMKVHS